MIPRYTRKEMADIWSSERRYRIWLEIELAAAEAMAANGEIPAEDFAALTTQLGGKEFSAADVAHIEGRVDAVGLLQPIQGLLLAAQLRTPVDGLGIRCIPFNVRIGLRAIEHVVRRHVQDVRAHPAGTLRNVTGAKTVDLIREIPFRLAEVNCGKGTAVQDQLRAQRGYDAKYLIALRKIYRWKVDAGHFVVVGQCEPRHDFLTELPTRARDEHPHNVARTLSGAHHQRWPRYQSTVAAKPVTKSISGRQPSPRSLLQSTEYRRSWPNRSAT